MNVPFPPLLLWPVVIGMVVGGILWRLWPQPRQRASPPEVSPCSHRES